MLLVTLRNSAWSGSGAWEKPDELEGEAHGLGVAQLVQVGGAGKVDHGRRTAQNNLDRIFFKHHILDSPASTASIKITLSVRPIS